MNKSVIYIVGAIVLVGGAYLFLKNKKEKDLSKLAELGGTTSGGTTSGGTTSGGATSGDGVSPSDANLNLANATILASQRKNIKPCSSELSFSGGGLFGGSGGSVSTGVLIGTVSPQVTIKRLAELDKKLADLGYKVDANCKLVKI
jgi:hypothetical protein